MTKTHTRTSINYNGERNNADKSIYSLEQVGKENTHYETDVAKDTQEKVYKTDVAGHRATQSLWPHTVQQNTCEPISSGNRTIIGSCSAFNHLAIGETSQTFQGFENTVKYPVHIFL